MRILMSISIIIIPDREVPAAVNGSPVIKDLWEAQSLIQSEGRTTKAQWRPWKCLTVTNIMAELRIQKSSWTTWTWKWMRAQCEFLSYSPYCGHDPNPCISFQLRSLGCLWVWQDDSSVLHRRRAMLERWFDFSAWQASRTTRIRSAWTTYRIHAPGNRFGRRVQH